jgi:hypothetical protein
MNAKTCDFVKFRLDISRDRELYFLLDTGADVSIIKSEKLIGSTEFEPREKVKLKGVEGSIVETHGSVNARIHEGNATIPVVFQLVSKQVDIQGDGILGKDVLQKMKAKICYENRILELKGETFTICKPLQDQYHSGKGESGRGRMLTLSGRSETVVRIPVACEENQTEGLIEKRQLQEGIILASSLSTVKEGYVVTSILNTNENEVRIPEPRITLEQIATEQVDMSKENKKIRDREKEVLDKLRVQHLNTEERDMLEHTCLEYQDLFYLPGDTLSCTNATRHSITLVPGTAPINTRPYRLPESQKGEIEKQVTKLANEGIIEESSSPWNSPLLIVPKKADASGEVKWRVVIDFRKLNEKTVGNAYPLPDITEILDQLGQSKYFSCLDMAMGYHQIEMAPEDKDKTAFSTKQGHWAYKRLPMGLKTAPATFQSLVNHVLSGLTGSRCFVFLDDIVIYARSLNEHDMKLRDVFARLRKYNLKLQPDKCEFLRKEVNYLGHVITEDGVRPDPRRVIAIENFPRPECEKTLKSFLGMAGYYRRFIPRFSKIAAPLHALLKKDSVFEWTADQENAFENLKAKLTNQPILQYPDFSREFILTTDASNQGLGAVLSQGKIGKDLPVAYASRNLNKAEKNYSTSEKELLAIVWGVKHFRPYLYGRKFKIASDHKPLTWIMNVKDPGSRLIRWRIKLEEYDYEIVYKKGALNTNADALSRINSMEKQEGNNENQEIGEDRKKQILYEYHDAPLGGHRGMNKTYQSIKSNFSWPNMKKEIEEYIKACKKCQVNKLLSPRKRAPMEITTTASHPFEKCSLDIVGPLPTTKLGNRYILTFQDDLTKFMTAVPIPQQDAETVAREFVTNVVLKMGAPRQLLTDQGTNFLSELFKSTCRMLKIKKIQTTAWRPESNGGLERSHRVLGEYLRHYVNEDQSNWDEWIPYAMYVYNTTSHTATGYTPFELVYGFRSILPSTLHETPSTQYSYDDYVLELKNRLQTAHSVARQKLILAKTKSKEYFDKDSQEFQVNIGDKVLLYDETVRRGRSRKLSAQWIGPYEVIGVDRVNATIKKGRRAQKVHINRLKPFY